MSEAPLTARLGDGPGQGCALWASWPRKSSPLFVALTEGGVRAAAAPDADGSDLELLWRRT